MVKRVNAKDGEAMIALLTREKRAREAAAPAKGSAFLELVGRSLATGAPMPTADEIIAEAKRTGELPS